MKRFRFRLERLRRVRRILDRQARQALAEAIAERVRVEAALDDLRTLRREHVDGMAALRERDTVDVRDILLQEADLEALDRRVGRLADTLEQAVYHEENRVRDLADARRDLEAVETLRTKARDAHLAECRREEISDLDEHTARRHAVARVVEDDR